ncbi:MAG: tetraacyldisaccharide 4'-kinase, partial [Planctomycetota bacterium]
PAIGLQRADAWVISGSMGEDDQAATAHLAGQPALAEVRAVWQGVHTVQGEEVSVQGKRCVVMAGIARPERIREALVEAGGIVAAMPPLADHDPISAGRLDQFRALSSEADALVLTAKDAARLGDRLQGWPVPVWIPQLALEVSSGEAALRQRVLSVLQ